MIFLTNEGQNLCPLMSCVHVATTYKEVRHLCDEDDDGALVGASTQVQCCSSWAPSGARALEGTLITAREATVTGDSGIVGGRVVIQSKGTCGDEE